MDIHYTHATIKEPKHHTYMVANAREDNTGGEISTIIYVSITKSKEKIKLHWNFIYQIDIYCQLT